ncbi:Calcium-activated potassium channel subunit alpha-1 [Homalodisca vitripennis]|nr:Calcium-activated potassium channel subunit alpha-1 [Homalodisca vitripennis]
MFVVTTICFQDGCAHYRSSRWSRLLSVLMLVVTTICSHDGCAHYRSYRWSRLLSVLIEEVEKCQSWSNNVTQQIDLAFNIFFMVYFFIRFIAASDKLWFMLEMYSFVDYFTIPPSFVSIYLDRTWIECNVNYALSPQPRATDRVVSTVSYTCPTPGTRSCYPEPRATDRVVSTVLNTSLRLLTTSIVHLPHTWDTILLLKLLFTLILEHCDSETFASRSEVPESSEVDDCTRHTSVPQHPQDFQFDTTCATRLYIYLSVVNCCGNYSLAGVGSFEHCRKMYLKNMD